MTNITVRKLDYTGREVWRYSGTTLERGASWIKLQAYFNRDDRDDGYVVWRRGDRFVEWFYADRWYNIFEVHDVADDRLKGWYCNITRPATIDDQTIGNEDLALDVWINPTGEVQILDEDEFAALPLDTMTRDKAWQAVDELQMRIQRRDAPFNLLKP